MPSPCPIRILIVDDNDLMRSLLRGILRSEDCEIVGEARNGVLALAFLERTEVDVVFLDLMMPEMDGLETLLNIKASYPEIKVIMVTGNPSKDNVEESIRNGANGFIVKPFNSAKVIDTLNKAQPSAGRQRAQ